MRGEHTRTRCRGATMECPLNRVAATVWLICVSRDSENCSTYRNLAGRYVKSNVGRRSGGREALGAMLWRLGLTPSPERRGNRSTWIELGHKTREKLPAQRLAVSTRKGSFDYATA